MAYLYDHYSGALYGVVIRIVCNEGMASEILQDGFLQVWNKIEQYDASKGRLFTWMFNIFRNLAIDKTRSREMSNTQKTDGIEDFVYDINKKNFEELNIEGIGLEEVLSDLNTDQQFVVRKIYFEGYTHSEVAKEFDIPLGTVKTRLRQSLIMLRKLLKVS